MQPLKFERGTASVVRATQDLAEHNEVGPCNCAAVHKPISSKVVGGSCLCLGAGQGPAITYWQPQCYVHVLHVLRAVFYHSRTAAVRPAPAVQCTVNNPPGKAAGPSVDPTQHYAASMCGSGASAQQQAGATRAVLALCSSLFSCSSSPWLSLCHGILRCGPALLSCLVVLPCWPTLFRTVTLSRLFVALLQTPQERTQAEQALRPFGQSTEYVSHCKVRAAVQQPSGMLGATVQCRTQRCSSNTVCWCR